MSPVCARHRVLKHSDHEVSCEDEDEDEDDCCDEIPAAVPVPAPAPAPAPAPVPEPEPVPVPAATWSINRVCRSTLRDPLVITLPGAVLRARSRGSCMSTASVVLPAVGGFLMPAPVPVRAGREREWVVVAVVGE